MKGIASNVTKAVQPGTQIPTCDNSGAKIVEVISVLRGKAVKGRRQAAGVGDMIVCTVKRGRPDIRKQVVHAVVVRQKKEFKRPDGMRIKFEDNAVVVCKDKKGNPRGTILKGAVAKEAADKWPPIANIASIIV